MPPKRKVATAKVEKNEEVSGGEQVKSPKAKRVKPVKEVVEEDQEEAENNAKKETKSRRVKKPVDYSDKTDKDGIDKIKKTTTSKAAKEAAKPKETKEKKTAKVKAEVKPKKVATKKKQPVKEESENESESADEEPQLETEEDPDQLDEPEEKPKKGRQPKSKKPPAEDVDEPEPKKRSTTKKEPAAAAAPSTTTLNKTNTDWDKIDFSCVKENANGHEFNVKITSWNVDGLRAWLKKDGLTILEHDKPDIFCLQETKCSEDKLPDEIKDVEGYNTYWCASDKDGYAGVALFCKVEPLDVQYGLGVAEHDDEGRCITAEFEKYYVVCVYVPNAGRKLVTLPKRLDWNEAFKKYIEELDGKKPVIICGDMNVAHNEIDLTNPKNNLKNAGFTKEERDGMSDFLKDGFVDTFRKLYPDQKDVYTFWTYMMKARSKNIGWRLDYFIVSERIVNNVCDSVIRSQVYGSDHCPITLFINF